jgi:hypothetical protein
MTTQSQNCGTMRARRKLDTATQWFYKQTPMAKNMCSTIEGLLENKHKTTEKQWSSVFYVVFAQAIKGDHLGNFALH